ncbi:hypothetical protein BDW59DRAFT_150311 [Aspergillus cavernicola]|uniref:Secreted protein n=1 Tax=Aspergillus cavernicola TaxID=176166 RepID=A0ABR4I0J7_9EURO
MPVVIWNAVEMTTSIICACLPMMPKLFRQLLHRNNSGSNMASASEPTNNLQKRAWYRKLGRKGSSTEVQLIEHSTSQTSSL